MKIEGLIFSIYAVFLGGAAVVYWILSEGEPTGTTALLISMGLGLLIGGYLLFTSTRIEPRPQDLPDAEVADGAGELGHFAPRSYWPFFIAMAAALALLGMIFGWWLTILAGLGLLFSAIGLVFEQYRNQFSPEDS